MNQFYLAGSLSLLLSAPAFAAPADAFTQRDVMQCGGVEVVLSSSCRSVTVDDAETHLIPVCSDQTINISGKVLRRDIGKVSQLTSDGVKTKMLSNVVVAMDCVAGWSLPLPGLQRMEKRSCSSMMALALRPIPMA
ncbi:hypothetical protein [Pseudomonas fluorescens]|uniref:hypothetical protein n=1 Tax=Pseudomonas fluorescens TaxID=294 RepID=UPI0030DB4E71